MGPFSQDYSTCIRMPEQAMGWFPLRLGLVVEDGPTELSWWYLIAGPAPTKKCQLQSDESAFPTPPTKRNRLQSDESAFSTDPRASQMSSKANNTSLAGPSSAALAHVHVPKTEAAIGLDAKLGTGYAIIYSWNSNVSVHLTLNA